MAVRRAGSVSTIQWHGSGSKCHGSETLLQRLRNESVGIPGNIGAGRLQAGKLALQIV
jgi:hypothetical protein